VEFARRSGRIPIVAQGVKRRTIARLAPMADTVSFSDTQLQKVLATVEAVKGSGIHWEQVIPVFVSALLAMCVGIGLEYFKDHRERKKGSKERQRKELMQLNGAATAMGYNVECLLHIVMQQVLPHHEGSHAALAALRAAENNAPQLRAFVETMHSEFTPMMTRCPEPYFIDLEFFKDIPFVLGKDPELLKRSGWMVSYVRALKELLSERNKHLDIAVAEKLDFQILEKQISVQARIADGEVVNSLMLFQQFLVICKKLKKNHRKLQQRIWATP
jgi:hypothetical protein